MAFVLAAAAIAHGPLAGTGRRPPVLALAAAAGTALAVVATTPILGGGVSVALASGLALAGFVLLLAGVASAACSALRSRAAGVAVAAGLGTLFLASFHLGDPLLEWGGKGSVSRTALTALHLVNPASGSVGHALELDWLRLPIMYSGFPGTVSGALSSAQYYLYTYPAWWLTALLHGGLGLALMLVSAGLFGFRRSRGAPKMVGVPGIVPDDTLTVVGEECPMNYVRTKIRLEELAKGMVLEVFVSDGAAAQNVPRSAREDGHDVLLVEPTAEGRVRLLIRKREV